MFVGCFDGFQNFASHAHAQKSMALFLQRVMFSVVGAFVAV